MYRSDRIREIILEEEFRDSALHERIHSKKSPSAEIRFVKSIKDINPLTQGADPFQKTTLVVSRFNGKFLSSCPGSGGMVCCRYFVINTGPGCLYDCHYCFLQSFMNTPYIHIYGNIQDIFSELDRSLENKKFHMRIGTGEYADSLALEDLTGVSGELIRYFSDKENATLELKTKSANIDSILDLPHGRNTVISWSMNPPKVISGIEEGTADLEERLDAAEKAVSAGYRAAFHFDPMIHFEGWESEYHAVLDRIAEKIDPWKIAWISLGTFRYSPGLKEIIQMRFSDDTITRAEMLQSSDGKFRYMKHVREEMYRSLKKKIESIHPELFSYMCMETKPMWETLEGNVPASAGLLDGRFEDRRRKMNARQEDEAANQ